MFIKIGSGDQVVEIIVPDDLPQGEAVREAYGAFSLHCQAPADWVSVPDNESFQAFMASRLGIQKNVVPS